MQAALRQQRQPAHEAKHHRPPAVQPRPFCKIPENDVRRDAPAELTVIAEEGKLDAFLNASNANGDFKSRFRCCADLAAF